MIHLFSSSNEGKWVGHNCGWAGLGWGEGMMAGAMDMSLCCPGLATFCNLI
jgi:hypothetical protein